MLQSAPDTHQGIPIRVQTAGAVASIHIRLSGSRSSKPRMAQRIGLAMPCAGGQRSSDICLIHYTLF